MNSYISFVVRCLQTFFVIKRAELRKHIKYPSLIHNVFKQYLLCFTKCEESSVAAKLPNCIALVFDRQSSKNAEYVQLFATLLAAKCALFETVCISMSPIENESIKAADQYIEHLCYVLLVVSKQFDNVIALIKENRSTNQNIPTKFKKFLIGCASRRFQPIICKALSDRKDSVNRVNPLKQDPKSTNTSKVVP